MNAKCTRNLTTMTAAATFACGLLVVPSANAMMEREMSVFGEAVELSDGEMGEVRGKFISGNQLTYFGVEMYTKWTDVSGTTFTTGVSLSADLSDDTEIRPTVTLHQSSEQGTATGTEGAGSGTTTISSPGLENISGVSQSIQVAGDQNDVNNELTIDVTAGGGSNTFGSLNGNSVSITTAGTTIISDEAGNMVTFSLDKDGFGYSIVNQQQDQVTQRVRNGAMSSIRGISQGVQLVSNLNQISNVTNIVAGQSRLADSIQQAELNSALLSLRGLQQGLF